MSDRRQCPVCKKSPPADHAWVDFDAHVSKCAVAFYERDKDARAKAEAEKLKEGLDDFASFLWGIGS